MKKTITLVLFLFCLSIACQKKDASTTGNTNTQDAEPSQELIESELNKVDDMKKRDEEKMDSFKRANGIID